jgi:prophage antirepressor-like protein
MLTTLHPTDISTYAYRYNGQPLNILRIDGELWFVAHQVATCAGLRDPISRFQNLKLSQIALLNLDCVSALERQFFGDGGLIITEEAFYQITRLPAVPPPMSSAQEEFLDWVDISIFLIREFHEMM